MDGSEPAVMGLGRQLPESALSTFTFAKRIEAPLSQVVDVHSTSTQTPGAVSNDMAQQQTANGVLDSSSSILNATPADDGSSMIATASDAAVLSKGEYTFSLQQLWDAIPIPVAMQVCCAGVQQQQLLCVV